MQDRMGYNGFIWFFGLVEDLDDPLRLGRVKVRIYNVHSPSEVLVPKDDLPWAHIIMPPTSASYNEVGMSPTGLLINSTVFGFFADGIEQQMPMILGSLPGIPQPDPDNFDPKSISITNHDVNKLARGGPGANKLSAVKDSPLARQGVEEIEPLTTTTFRAVYPFNKVYETRGPNINEQGHVVEFDDSPGAERIHIYHKLGSYVEMSPGLTVVKTNGTNIEIDMIDKVVRVKGDYIMDISGNYQTTVGGNMTLIVNGAISILSNSLISMDSLIGTTISSKGFLSTQTTGFTSMSSAAYMSFQAGGYMDVKVGAFYDVKVGGQASFVTGGQFLQNIGGLMSLNVGGTLSMGAGESMFLLSGVEIAGIATFIRWN